MGEKVDFAKLLINKIGLIRQFLPHKPYYFFNIIFPIKALIKNAFVNQSTDGIGICAWTYHQDVALLRHDIAIESGNNGFHVVRKSHHAVLCALKHHFGSATHGIAIGIGVGHFAKLRPATHVCPTKVALLHSYIGAMLEHKEVDTLGQSFGYARTDECHLFSDCDHLLGYSLNGLVGAVSHLREMVTKCLTLPKENARIPKKFATIDKHTSVVNLWFFTK